MLSYIHVVAIPDRYDDLSDEDVGDLASDSFLINGRGRFGDNNAPLIVHRVQSGDNYLFRFINVGFDNMFEVSLAKRRLGDAIVIKFEWSEALANMMDERKPH